MMKPIVNNEEAQLAIAFLDLAKTFALPIAVALIAAVLGYWLGLRRFRKERRQDFVSRQVTLFYSPMAGYRRRIRASSELRVELSRACGVAWQKICDERSGSFEDHESQFEPFRRQIEDENQRFPKYLLPLYDEMVKTFTEQYWLAEATTREFYGPFCRYVELWHRLLDDAIPSRVLEEITIEEDSLEPFYKDLEQRLSELRAELAHEKERT